MTLFKKLFGSKQTHEEKKPNVEEKIALEIKTIDQSLKFEGIDLDFIKLIYFSDKESETEYISNIKRVIKEYHFDEITNAQKLTDTIQEVYVSEDEIPFFVDTILYKNIRTQRTTKNGVHEDKIIDSGVANRGAEKLNNIYTKRDLLIHNINSKSNAGETDFKNEELQTEEFFKQIEFSPDIMEIQIILALTNAYLKNRNIEKIQVLVEKIIQYLPNLTENNQANIHKEIGEIYLELNNSESALLHFEKGLELNPKLSVKNHIKKIKK